MAHHYDWELFRYGAGVLTRLHDGAEVFMQGDDVYSFDEAWDACETDEQQDLIASEYGEIMEVPENGA